MVTSTSQMPSKLGNSSCIVSNSVYHSRICIQEQRTLCLQLQPILDAPTPQNPSCTQMWRCFAKSSAYCVSSCHYLGARLERDPPFLLASHLWRPHELLKHLESPQHRSCKRTSCRPEKVTKPPSLHQELMWKQQALYRSILLLLSHCMKGNQQTLLLSGFFF